MAIHLAAQLSLHNLVQSRDFARVPETEEKTVRSDLFAVEQEVAPSEVRPRRHAELGSLRIRPTAQKARRSAGSRVPFALLLREVAEQRDHRAKRSDLREILGLRPAGFEVC